MVRSALQPLSGALRRLRARLAARPDTEHEQALVRLVIAVVVFFYLLPEAFGLAGGKWNLTHPMFVIMVCEVIFSAAVLACILAWPGTSPVRRVVGMVGDAGAVTAVMALAGPHGMPLYLVYVWVTLANGFRFGARYLLLSLAASVIGFGLVLYVNDYWRANFEVWLSLEVGLVALSMYVRSLVTRMFEAIARAEAANQAKRRFISVISHEMRTPLNAIIGMADLIRDTALNREQADMVQTLRSSSRMMLGLVEDVLDFSKIEAGKLVLEASDFDLHALLNSTTRIMAAQADAKGVEFVLSIMPEVPPAVRGDPHYLRQVLVNLAGNAIKFTEQGSVTLHVSAQAEDASFVHLKFSIRDTGIGMAQEVLHRIFDSFTQADQSTTRRFGGTGLGTTIAKQLVELMRGRIGVESAVGLGSTFWFELKFEKQPERSEAGTGELAGARVLLVGFPPDHCHALEQALAGWGAAAVAVGGLEEGSARLVAEISLARPYHSAVLYWSGGDFRLAQRFKRNAPDPAPPIVLAAPREAVVPRFDALSAGFSAVLELPVDKRQLFNALHSVSARTETGEGVVRLQDYAQRGAAVKKLRVLVADDNPTNRQVIGKILERGGHLATLVTDGEQALDAVENDRYDIVILDRNMPGIGGIEALQAIRLTTHAAGRIPVVMLSADATPEARRAALEAGADMFLSKPVEAVRLLESIHSLAASALEHKVAELPALARMDPSAAGQTAKAPPVINIQTLTHLEELGSSAMFVEKLIRVFLADNAGLAHRVEQALAARNFHEVRLHLHAIKGSAASMGTESLTRLCANLSALSDAEMRLQTASLIRSLLDELAAARGELERYLSERKASSG